MKLINLTPHAINFVTEDGDPVLTVNPSGQIARVTAKTVNVGEVETCVPHKATDTSGNWRRFIPVTATSYGEVEGLPDPEEGTVYIVSSLVASRVPCRADVFIPNESVRDGAGRIVGCKSLGHV